MKLEPEKRKTILDAAFEEFADYGYEYASTNRIVQKAKIGKGMLFYYFNSKKDLFNYLVVYGLEYIDKYYNMIDENEADFIEKHKKIAKIKLKSYTDNPYIFNFFGTLYLSEYDGLTDESKNKILGLRSLGFSRIYSNIDKGLFRDDIDPDQIIKLINYTMTGYETELVNELKGKKLSSINYDPYWEEFNDFLELIRKIYYK